MRTSSDARNSRDRPTLASRKNSVANSALQRISSTVAPPSGMSAAPMDTSIACECFTYSARAANTSGRGQRDLYRGEEGRGGLCLRCPATRPENFPSVTLTTTRIPHVGCIKPASRESKMIRTDNAERPQGQMTKTARLELRVAHGGAASTGAFFVTSAYQVKERSPGHRGGPRWLQL
jgi:hypothetical protein